MRRIKNASGSGKWINRLAKFIVRVDPKAVEKINADMSNEELVRFLRQIFNRDLSYVKPIDRGLCYEVARAGQSYIRAIQNSKKRVAPILHRWIVFEYGLLKAREIKRIAEHVIMILNKADIETLNDFLEKVKKASNKHEVASAFTEAAFGRAINPAEIPDMAMTIYTDINHDESFTKKKVIKEILRLEDKYLTALKEKLLAKLNKLISQKEKENKALSYLRSILKQLERKYGTPINITDLAYLGNNLWWIEINIANKSYAFDLEARNIKELKHALLTTLRQIPQY